MCVCVCVCFLSFSIFFWFVFSYRSHLKCLPFLPAFGLAASFPNECVGFVRMGAPSFTFVSNSKVDQLYSVALVQALN